MTEDGRDLRGAAPLARQGENLTQSRWDKVARLQEARCRTVGRRDREAEAAEVVVLVVVAVPAAVVLHKVELDLAAIGQLDRLVGHEDGLAGLISPAGADIRAPGGLVLAVDGKFDRPGDALLVAA